MGRRSTRVVATSCLFNTVEPRDRPEGGRSCTPEDGRQGSVDHEPWASEGSGTSPSPTPWSTRSPHRREDARDDGNVRSQEPWDHAKMTNRVIGQKVRRRGHGILRSQGFLAYVRGHRTLDRVTFWPFLPGIRPPFQFVGVSGFFLLLHYIVIGPFWAANYQLREKHLL